ncbi:DNA mismatch repair protein MutL, partial [Vibrio parahaemolyticus]|nr:DNA mismatch repair protein MutL [Vibrio parahaemolyticus]
PGRTDYEIKPRDRAPSDSSVRESLIADSFNRTDWIESKLAPKPNVGKERHAEPDSCKREVHAYHELLKSPDFDSDHAEQPPSIESVRVVSLPLVTALGKA